MWACELWESWHTSCDLWFFIFGFRQTSQNNILTVVGFGTDDINKGRGVLGDKVMLPVTRSTALGVFSDANLCVTEFHKDLGVCSKCVSVTI